MSIEKETDYTQVKVSEWDIEFVFTESSNCLAGRYNRAEETLQIDFHRGGKMNAQYNYYKVPEQKVEELSKLTGKEQSLYFRQEILNAGYTCELYSKKT